MSDSRQIRPIYVLILGMVIILFFYLRKEDSPGDVFKTPLEKDETIVFEGKQFVPSPTDVPSTVMDTHSEDHPIWATLNREGLKAFNHANYEQALKLFKKALKQRPENETIKKNIEQTHAQLGWTAIRANHFSEAIPNFDKAIEITPGEPAHYIGKALAMHRLERRFEAIDTVGIGLKLNPVDAVLYRIGGDIYYDQNEYQKAIQAWENAIRINPEDRALSASLEKLKREHRLFSGFQSKGSSHFTLLFEGREDRTWIRPVLQSLEDAYQRIGQKISYFPQRTILTVLYTDQQFRDVTKSPTWTKALFDGKIHLPIGGSLKDIALLRKLIYHEYTHALIHQLSHGRVPTWLNEGLAIFFEDETGQAHPSRTGRVTLTAQSIIPLDKLHGSFMIFDEKTADIAYAESELATAYLIRRYGFFKIKHLLERLASGIEFPTAFDQTFLISYGEFQTEFWKEVTSGM